MADQSAHISQLQALLPVGTAWPRDPDTELTKLIEPVSAELARIDDFRELIQRELDPRTTTELLSEYEEMCGLPAPCAPVAQTESERRAAVVAVITERGGQSAAYFEAIALKLGYIITVTSNKPRMMGGGLFGDLYAGEAWRWVFDVNAEATSVRSRSFGGPFGEFYATWGFGVLECLMNNDQPPHLQPRFIYGSTEPRLLIKLLTLSLQQQLLNVQLNPLI